MAEAHESAVIEAKAVMRRVDVELVSVRSDMGERPTGAETMTSETASGTFQSFLERQLQDPAFREAYEDAQTRERLIDCLVNMRHQRGMKQTQVGQAMGVGQPTISGLETEGSDPRISTLQRYARALGSRLHLGLAVQTTPAWQQPNYSRADPSVRTCEVIELDTARRWTASPSQWRSA